MDHALQGSCAFAVDDPYLEDAALLARGQILRHKVFYLTRLEGMEIEHPVDGELNKMIII